MRKIISITITLFSVYAFSQDLESINQQQTIVKSNNLVIKQEASINTLIMSKREYNKNKILKLEKHTCHPYPKNGMVPGYKIQLDRFKTKSEADNKVKMFSKIYPNIHASVRYETPNYKVYVGNYFTSKKMDTDLKMIRKKFSGAFSIQSKIYIDKDDWNSKYCPSKSRRKTTNS